MSHHQLSQALVDSFTALADEVQSLTDSKTVLEHKLRFAHEQVSAYITQFHLLSTFEFSCSRKLQAPIMMSYLSSRSRAA